MTPARSLADTHLPVCKSHSVTAFHLMWASLPPPSCLEAPPTAPPKNLSTASRWTRHIAVWSWHRDDCVQIKIFLYFESAKVHYKLSLCIKQGVQSLALCRCVPVRVSMCTYCPLRLAGLPRSWLSVRACATPALWMHTVWTLTGPLRDGKRCRLHFPWAYKLIDINMRRLRAKHRTWPPLALENGNTI